MVRRTAALFVLGAAALVLSACQLRLSVDIDVDRNGGGTFGVTLGADAELLARAAGAGVDPLGDLAAAVSELDGWAVAQHADEDGGRAVTVSARFADPDAFASLSADLSEALAAPEAVPLEPMALTVAGDRMRVEGAAGLVPTERVTDLGLLPDDAVRLASERDAVSYTLQVGTPGRVLETSADAYDDRVVRWDVAPGERVDVWVVSERPPPWTVPLVAGGVAGALAAVVAVVLLLRRFRWRPPLAPL